MLVRCIHAMDCVWLHCCVSQSVMCDFPLPAIRQRRWAHPAQVMEDKGPVDVPHACSMCQALLLMQFSQQTVSFSVSLLIRLAIFCPRLVAAKIWQMQMVAAARCKELQCIGWRFRKTSHGQQLTHHDHFALCRWIMFCSSTRMWQRQPHLQCQSPCSVK